MEMTERENHHFYFAFNTIFFQIGRAVFIAPDILETTSGIVAFHSIVTQHKVGILGYGKNLRSRSVRIRVPVVIAV